MECKSVVSIERVECKEYWKHPCRCTLTLRRKNCVQYIDCTVHLSHFMSLDIDCTVHLSHFMSLDIDCTVHLSHVMSADIDCTVHLSHVMSLDIDCTVHLSHVMSLDIDCTGVYDRLSGRIYLFSHLDAHEILRGYGWVRTHREWVVWCVCVSEGWEGLPSRCTVRGSKEREDTPDTPNRRWTVLRKGYEQLKEVL